MAWLWGKWAQQHQEVGQVLGTIGLQMAAVVTGLDLQDFLNRTASSQYLLFQAVGCKRRLSGKHMVQPSQLHVPVRGKPPFPPQTHLASVPYTTFTVPFYLSNSVLPSPL